MCNFPKNEIYVSPNGCDNNSGLLGSPKQHIYDGLKALRALGGGTLKVDNNSRVGGPVEGQGIWLRRDFNVTVENEFNADNYMDVLGFIPLDVPYRIEGIGNASPAGPFTVAPNTDYIGGGSHQFLPALWIVGCTSSNQTFEMVNMQSSWIHQAEQAVSPRAGRLGARIYVDFDRELDGSIKHIDVLNATRTGNSTVLTVDIDNATPIVVESASRSGNVTTLVMTNPGLPCPPWNVGTHIKFTSGDEVNFSSGDKLITAVSNYFSSNATWTVSYAETAAPVAPTPIADSSIQSHACRAGDLLWLTSTNDEFAEQQYYITDNTAGTVTIEDHFRTGDADEDDIGSISHQERRRCPTPTIRFERCSFGIDSSFTPWGATHAWDIGGNLAIVPTLVDCWGEGSVSGGGLPYYDWRCFAALYAYAGGGESASVDLTRFMCNNGGIYVENPAGPSSVLIARDCLVEQASFSSELPGIKVDGNTFTGVYIDNFTNADGANGFPAVEINGVPMSAAHVFRSGFVKGACIGGDNFRVPSLWGPVSNPPTPWEGFDRSGIQVTAWADGRITGKHPAAVRLGGPVGARYKNVVQAAADWIPDSGGTVTPGAGVEGPFGGTTDLIETTNVSSTLIKLYGSDGSTWEEGGRFVVCGWVHATAATDLRDGLFSVQSTQFTPTLAAMGPGYHGTGWQFVSGHFEVTAAAAPNPAYTIFLTLAANAEVSLWGLTAFYVPADVDDNDFYELAGTLKHQPRYLLPGMTGTMEDAPFIGHGGLGSGLSYVEGAAVGQLTIAGSFSPKKYEPIKNADGTIKGWVELMNATINVPEPDSIDDLVLWLDADTVAGSDGDAIATWANQASTGSTNDATQSTSGKQPLLKKASNGINGHNVLRFDGSNDYMTGIFNPGSIGMTVFYVVRTGSSLSVYGTVLGSGGAVGVVGDNPTAGIWWAFSCGNASDGYGAGWNASNGSGYMGSVSGIATNTVFYGRYATDKTAWAIDGVNTGTPSDTSFPSGTFNYHLGAAGAGTGAGGWPYSFNGDVAEIVIYTRKLTDDEMAVVKTYLQTKYNF